MRNLLNLLRAKAAVINWQYFFMKWGLIAALATGWTYHWYDKGVTKCETAQSIEYAKQLSDEVGVRMPVVQQAERRAALLEQELSTLKRMLDEEATKPYNPDCSVSDEQLRIYRELSDKTTR